MNTRSVGALPSRPSPGAAGTRLAELYEAHARMVYGVSRLLLRDADEAEDATQQVFLLAYRSLLTGTEVRAPSAWLGTIARNECRARIQTRTRQPLALADEPTLVGPGPDELASESAEIAALYTELAALPEKQREAVVLRDVYGLRYAEVAAALDTSLPAVESLLFRGRRRLQRRLRPGFAAGVIAVPLAVHESLAYAVPGFAGAAAGTGAAVQVGLLAKLGAAPVLAKLAAAGAAVGVAGSAGLVAERELRDPPRRPAAAIVRAAPSLEQREPSRVVTGRTAALFVAPAVQVEDRSGSGGGGQGSNGDAAGSSGPGGGEDEQGATDERGGADDGGPDEAGDADHSGGNAGPGKEERNEPEPTVHSDRSRVGSSKPSDRESSDDESSDSESADSDSSGSGSSGSDSGPDSSGSDDSGSPEQHSDDGEADS